MSGVIDMCEDDDEWFYTYSGQGFGFEHGLYITYFIVRPGLGVIRR